ncbi:MAG: DUF2726 domain-containing protein [Pseudomonadota bacterium]
MSLAEPDHRRPSPFKRILTPVVPFRNLWGGSGSRRVSSVEVIDTTPIAAAPLLDELRRGRFVQLCEIAHERGLHVAPEVSLGALFTLDHPASRQGAEDVAKALRGKRVDFVLIDGAAQAVLAIDYRGEGPWRGRALRRDRLKRRAFEKADIPLIELGGQDDWPDDRARILRLLGQAPVTVARERPAA